MTKLAWGIIGTGAIAHTFAKGLAQSRTSELVAVGSRARETADKFAAEFGLKRAYGSYDALLADKSVKAVYISTPHPSHAMWAIRAADAGKHVLCEKPLAVNFPDAMAVVEAARRNDVFLMEAFMYRCHPQTRKLVELIRDGVIGEVRVIQAAFSFNATFRPEGRLFAQTSAGGGILDVGCYPVSLSRLVAGAALGKDFADPVEVKGVGHLGESGVDEWAAAVLRFPGDIIAEVSTGVRVTQDNSVRIYGSKGHIHVPTPWIPLREGGESKIIVHVAGEKEPRAVEIKTDEWLYALEADTVAMYLDRRQAASPAMSWDDTLGNMRALDRWRDSIGLVYDLEKPEAQTRPVHGGPLRVRKGSHMEYGEIPGVGKKVSRLIMGADNQPDIAWASVVFDDYYERGGTCIDTAYVYGGASGRSERLVGQWVRNRGLRGEIVIIDKGAHTPQCNPEALTRQLHESLDRLGSDYIDIYLMHRDNLDIPVGEFIDVLNEHKSAGRMRAFGASNWTLERFQAAQGYARKNGKEGFSAISNNFSLAEMITPVWTGCLSSSGVAWRRYLEETQTPLLPWSSQARGFFTDRAKPDDLSDPEIVKCWYSEANFRRQARAKELAQKHGVEPINIALAYVLAQPFPTYPLIGPRTIAETVSSFKALDVRLDPDEVRWLNLEE